MGNNKADKRRLSSKNFFSKRNLELVTRTLHEWVFKDLDMLATPAMTIPWGKAKEKGGPTL
jgi:hypothetical protein